jgi:hypothetical protein
MDVIFTCNKCLKTFEKDLGDDFFEEVIDPGLKQTVIHFCDYCLEKWETERKESLKSFIQPERSKREDGESRCGALNSMET